MYSSTWIQFEKNLFITFEIRYKINKQHFNRIINQIVSSCLWKTKRGANESFSTYESSYYTPLLLLADSEQSKRKWMDMIDRTRQMINNLSIADNTV